MSQFGDAAVLRYSGTHGEFPGLPMGNQRHVNVSPITAARADGTIVVDATAGAFTVTLFSAVGLAGRRIFIIKSDISANAVTIAANGAETINGAATQSLATQFTGLLVESDGTNWFQVGSSSGGGGSSTSQTQNTVTVVAGQSPYTPLATDWMIRCDTTAGAITVTLPAAAGAVGRVLNIKKIINDANTVTVDANAAETIDGALTQVLAAQYANLTIQSNGTGWDIL